MTCQHCGKTSPEGTKPATRAWCVDCQKALLAPPERFLGYPRVSVETRGNAKWEYRLQVAGLPISRVVEVRVYQPGIKYKIIDHNHAIYPNVKFVSPDGLSECLQRLSEGILSEARALLDDAQSTLDEAQSNRDTIRQWVDQITSEATPKEACDFWSRLGVE